MTRIFAHAPAIPQANRMISHIANTFELPLVAQAASGELG